MSQGGDCNDGDIATNPAAEKSFVMGLTTTAITRSTIMPWMHRSGTAIAMEMDLPVISSLSRHVPPSGFSDIEDDCDDSNPNVIPVQPSYVMVAMTTATGVSMRTQPT